MSNTLYPSLCVLRRWIWVWVLRLAFKSQTVSMYKLPFLSKHRLLSFKTVSVSSLAHYHSHIPMARWKRDGFWLLSLCLLSCSFPKTIQLKPIVLYFHKAHDISFFFLIFTTQTAECLLVVVFVPEWSLQQKHYLSMETCRRSCWEKALGWRWQSLLLR